jgi:hypothetical protein
MPFRWILRLSLVPLLFSASVAAAARNWPQFRGPNSAGVAHEENLPDRWSATENVAWTCEIPGRGWSSPVVWEDRVFLTTVINLGQSEEPRKGLYFGGERPKPPESTHQSDPDVRRTVAVGETDLVSSRGTIGFRAEVDMKSLVQ